MERTINRVAVGAFAFAIALFVALSFAPQARAATQVADAPTDLAAQAAGANISKDRAYQLAFGTAASGYFEYQQDSKAHLNEYWYKFKTTNRDSIYYLKVSSPGRLPFALGREDAEGNDSRDYWTTLSDGGPSSVVTPNVSYAECWQDNAWNLKKGTWQYICLSPRNDTYHGTKFNLVVTEYRPLDVVENVKKTKATKSSLTVKWKKQSTAQKYQVQYKAKGGKWVSKSTTKNSIKLTSLKKNSTYQVRVRAYNEKGWNVIEQKPSKWGDWSDVKSMKTAKK